MPEFDPSAFWGIAGIVVGIIVATIFFLLGKKKTLLQYAISTTQLVTEKMAVILNGRMSIDDQPVKSLSSTTIIFINSGNQRIKSSDFSGQEPLRIILQGHLYGYDVSLGNQKLRPFINPVNEKVLNILFENLKQGQFFSVTILHDETLDVFGELTTGTMRKYSSSKILKIILGIFSIGATALLVDGITAGPISTLADDLGSMILFGIVLLTLWLIYIIDIYRDRKKAKLFHTSM